MTKSAFSIEGKNLLITGASSGIGKSIALTLDREGGNLFVVGRNSERLDATYNKLTGQNKSKYICDLLLDNELDELVLSLPSLDGIVFCAGVIEYLPGKFISREKIENIFGINYNSQILLYQKLYKSKKIKKRSSLVFISSISTQIGVPGTLLYASSKAALNASVRVLASELASQRVRVNSISPGIILTPMIENAENVVDRSTLEKGEINYPLGYGDPEDVANAVVFLLSDASKWITGINLIVDGGFTLK